MTNIIRIKRRAVGGAAGAPASLQPAEVAFNEVDRTLYYGFGSGGAGGTATNVIAIGGDGAFLTLSSAQTITGAKTFTGGVVVPTVAANDNSGAAASTAFVKGLGFLTSNQSITISGDASGSGTTNIALTLGATGVAAGTYTKLTVNAKGLVTASGSLLPADITGALGYTPVDAATRGAANGVATLDGSGKLTAAQIPASLLGAVVYQGVWNATTNTPPLASSTGTKGFYYKVSVAGTTVLDGIGQWYVGDTVIYDGATWDKIDGITNEVISVAGKTGAVTLVSTDIGGLGTLATANVATVAQGGTGLSTAVTGLLKGNGTLYAAAVVNVDYLDANSVLDGGTF